MTLACFSCPTLALRSSSTCEDRKHELHLGTAKYLRSDSLKETGSKRGQKDFTDAEKQEILPSPISFQTLTSPCSLASMGRIMPRLSRRTSSPWTFAQSVSCRPASRRTRRPRALLQMASAKAGKVSRIPALSQPPHPRMGDEVRKVLVRYISFSAQDRLDSERIYEEIDALKEKLAKIHQEQDASADVQVEKKRRNRCLRRNSSMQSTTGQMRILTFKHERRGGCGAPHRRTEEKAEDAHCLSWP